MRVVAFSSVAAAAAATTANAADRAFLHSIHVLGGSALAVRGHRVVRKLAALVGLNVRARRGSQRQDANEEKK